MFSFLPRLLHKKTVVTVQGLDWQRKKWGHFASGVLRLGEQAAIRFPNATMVVSRTLQEYFDRQYHAPTFYVPNGGTVREKRPLHHLPQWKLDPAHYILFLGRFSPEKNCHLLIQAYEQIDTDVKLVLAGGSSHTTQYAQELRTHACGRIVLLDWLSGDALDELLTNAVLFVLPSDLEGLSLALLDAMGAGLCVLTSDIPENCELVEGAGFTFKCGDVTDLERMIRLLLADSRVREEAGRSAREKIRTHYQWSQITAEIERVYLSLLGESAAPAVAEHFESSVKAIPTNERDRVAP